MYLTWRERLIAEPNLIRLRNWPVVDILTLEPQQRPTFLRNQRILARALGQESLKAIAADEGVHPSMVTYLLKRSLAGPEETAPALTQALVPDRRLSAGHRRTPLPQFAQPAGAAYAFRQLLDTVDGLEAYLQKLIGLFAGRARRGQNLRVQNFHKAFIRFLRGVNWPQDCYPFTVRSQGQETLRLYFHRQIQLKLLPDKEPPPLRPSRTPVTCYREIEIDEHTVDCHSSIVIELDVQWEPLRLSRITLIAAREVGTGAVLAYILVLNDHPSADDVQDLLAKLVEPWPAPSIITPGLQYPPGAGMPTALGSNFQRVAFGIIRLDNAMIHLAGRVKDFITSRLFATMNVGHPRCPLARPLIEAAFRELNLTVHRIPSTTGTHSQDPWREPSRQQKQAPIISLRALEEIIQIQVATMNQRAKGNLGGQTPIELLKWQMNQHWIPLRPDAALIQVRPYIGTKVVRVKGPTQQHPLPWINFGYLRYNRRGVIPANLVGKNIRIEFDRRATGEIKAFTLNGAYLGILLAPESWRRFPFGLSTQLYIGRMIKEKLIAADDPFGNYFDYHVRHRDNPSSALEVIRLTRELGRFILQTSVAPNSPVNQPLPQKRIKVKPDDSVSLESQQHTLPALTKPAQKASAIPGWSTSLIQLNTPQLPPKKS